MECRESLSRDYIARAHATALTIYTAGRGLIIGDIYSTIGQYLLALFCRDHEQLFISDESERFMQLLNKGKYLTLFNWHSVLGHLISTSWNRPIQIYKCDFNDRIYIDISFAPWVDKEIEIILDIVAAKYVNIKQESSLKYYMYL